MTIPQDVLVEASRVCLAQGVKILQGYRLADTDEAHVAKLLAHMAPKPDTLWADIGCGFGEVARVMCEQRPDLSFFLVNNNEFQLAHTPEGFRAIQADMEDIPLGDGTVDGCMFLYSLCHAPDMLFALIEAARITRPGGELYVYDYERMGGDNALMRQCLYAKAFPFDDIVDTARMAGWKVTLHYHPAGSDELFRQLYPNQEEYDEIFEDLRPVIWKAVRV
jgi:SAM-dependent methyltransferase